MFKILSVITLILWIVGFLAPFFTNDANVQLLAWSLPAGFGVGISIRKLIDGEINC
jgi:hypothetical protein